MNFVEKTVKEIKSLKVQGARNVRIAAVKALLYTAKNSKAKTPESFRKELWQTALKLARTRPTEPEMRTAIRVILNSASKNFKVEELKKQAIEAGKNYEEDRKKAMQKIAEYGANVLEKNSVILTHCHSHTVVEVLKLAHKKGKIKQVFCTETRPLFQGRKTAKDLSKTGIKTTMIIDSAAYSFMKKCNYFITGADAILSNGSIVNKIGTMEIALASKHFGVPFYVCSSSHKIDPASFLGIEETIEQRHGKEVWNKKMKNFSISNPAFDVTEADLVKAVISEKGVLAPKTLAGLAYNELSISEEEKTYLSLAREKL